LSQSNLQLYITKKKNHSRLITKHILNLISPLTSESSQPKSSTFNSSSHPIFSISIFRACWFEEKTFSEKCFFTTFSISKKRLLVWGRFFKITSFLVDFRFNFFTIIRSPLCKRGKISFPYSILFGPCRHVYPSHWIHGTTKKKKLTSFWKKKRNTNFFCPYFHLFLEQALLFQPVPWKDPLYPVCFAQRLWKTMKRRASLFEVVPWKDCMFR